MFEAMTWLQANRDDLRLRMLREPRGYPAANCNLVLPSANPEAAAGYVIMEQVEYPGMSGTNTMCVVTALLETGMLPMTEPVTELTLEAPAGLIRVRADCCGWQGHRGHVPERAGVRDPPRHARRGAPARHGHRRRRVRRDVLRHRLGGGVRAAADARRGRRHRPDHRDDQGRGRRAAAGRPSRAARASPGSRSASCSGPAHDPANAMRNVVTVSTGTLDWERPATWTGAIDRSPCGTGTSRPDGDPPREGPARDRRGLPPRGDPRHGLHRPAARGDARSASRPAVVPQITGQAWITGIRRLRRRPDRSVPRRLHDRRHLGLTARLSAGSSAG